ncbi:E3 ubiquitin-protein ligase rififylin isoform X1 [Syngnathus typhle]|uniref:E3 ubiquitin-protein ligase rififylin isoform X1 n=1 Tax=Syngnathus typhle TaxID=161592 RepID=UPI002A698A1F|nr:E3 ubiquitin-protein ligase rififylin isoform X1 [Syngnathus typhle]
MWASCCHWPCSDSADSEAGGADPHPRSYTNSAFSGQPPPPREQQQHVCKACGRRLDTPTTKHVCADCKENYCGRCSAQSEPRPRLCHTCRRFYGNLLQRAELMKLKVKELRDYLHLHHVATHLCREKEELVELILSQQSLPSESPERDPAVASPSPDTQRSPGLDLPDRTPADRAPADRAPADRTPADGTPASASEDADSLERDGDQDQGLSLAGWLAGWLSPSGMGLRGPRGRPGRGRPPGVALGLGERRPGGISECAAAEGNSGQELCQLQRLLREVGADGESGQTLPGPSRQQRRGRRSHGVRPEPVSHLHGRGHRLRPAGVRPHDHVQQVRQADERVSHLPPVCHQSRPRLQILTQVPHERGSGALTSKEPSSSPTDRWALRVVGAKCRADLDARAGQCGGTLFSVIGRIKSWCVFLFFFSTRLHV